MSRLSPNRRHNTPTRIFAVPVLIAVISLIGLVAALLGDGVLDVMSWVGLAMPVVMIGWAMVKRR
ncbi:Putative membrane protein [Alloalcanivorax dieselolei B5]|uniref:Putative membrane protein n=1 Tax=Alcanivorax dieselolei (strain DSM 16502 / CGMCC 1.3690 / MCCC 1A00001 / B-5) TaxID=930169 RepID=K0C7A4_ALCDB|nr:hypothetical protein [Alloalcanivorax dieselolei]AFT69324.1 Putative membrane protein [Alloalcanivorax dieselolei B5]GGJ91737.1 hypothetical protein GCM10007426_21080 [Alloalcanivorax dieselolei]